MKIRINSMPEYAFGEKFVCLIQHEEGVWTYAGVQPTKRRAEKFVAALNCFGTRMDDKQRMYCSPSDVLPEKVFTTLVGDPRGAYVPYDEYEKLARK